MALSRFFRRARWDDERSRELDAYLAIETDENVARGMPIDEARAAARRKLGSPLHIREEIYQMNTLTFLDAAWRDLRYGARLLRLNPGFAIVAILSLALGVGANTAIFQLLDAVRIRTLPVARPQELVDVRIMNASHGRTGDFHGRVPYITYPQWEQIRDRQQAFSDLFAWSPHNFELASGGETRPARGLWVSGGFFETLGVGPLVGRVLSAADDRRGCAAPPAVISYGFWQSEYAGSASAIGRTLRIDGHAFDIVGVTPASFFGVEVGQTFDVVAPLCAEPLTAGVDSALERRDVWFLGVMGRLKDGWTAERATAHLGAISPSIMQATLPAYRPQDATDYLAFKFSALPAGTGVSSLRRTYESPLWLLLATTALVLVIACANLANLMLARATAREREIAVRLALGASRVRIVRQLLAESLLIAAIGAAAGAALAVWLSQALVGLLTTDRSRIFVDLALDWRVFAFTASLAVITCLLFGLLPALRATAQTPGAAMKAGSRGLTDSRERFGIRRALVVAQVALSLVLVVGALLFVRSLRNLTTVDAGFRQDGLLIANIEVRRDAVPEGRRLQLFEDITRRVRALPGVSDAAQVYIVPVSGAGWNNSVVIDGKKHSENSEVVNFNRVGDRYFETVGTPLLAGRDFDTSDTLSATKVAIVTEAFTRKFFGGQNPVGRTFQIDERPGVPNPVYQIVGLVKDSKYQDLRDAFAPLAYFPSMQDDRPSPDMSLVVRAGAPLTQITSAIGGALHDVDPSIIVEYQTMASQVKDSLVRDRLMAMLSGFFGGLAALIAMIGLYGVMSYSVMRRQNEIGIRMALGADRRQVLAMVMREAVTLLSVGLVVGIGSALVAARSASALLFGLQPHDPPTLVMAAAALATVALGASYVPALRASRLEPTRALREE